MAVSLVRDELFFEHDPGRTHPECPERLTAIEDALRTNPLSVHAVPARRATLEEVERAHDPNYIAELLGLDGQRTALDPDTRVSPGSVRAAFHAAGGAIELATRIATRRAPAGLALVRPPGHHATKDRAMGFCLINNVAVAAHALLAEGLAERVAIYDFDVHHGNGTQDIFEQDPRVLYLSTHQWPLYPGTGAAHERGRGAGVGTTLNVPLPEGSDDGVLFAVWDGTLLPAVRAFRPDFILLSAGFDAYERDPIGGLKITIGGYAELGRRWAELAQELCGGNIAAVLEGGYDLPGLGACVRAFLGGLDA